MIVPQEIRNREFGRKFNGYDEDEVTVFLELLADEFEELYLENEKLKGSLRQIRDQVEIFKETEGKLDQILEVSRRKVADLGGQAKREADCLLEQARIQVNQTLGSYQEVIQRLTALSAAARSLLQENRDFYQEEKLLPMADAGQKVFDPAIEIELAGTQVDELLNLLDEYEQSLGEHRPANCGEITVQPPVSPLWSDTVSAKPSEDKVIVPTVLEQKKPVVPPIKTPARPALEIPWEMPRAVRQKRRMNARSRWLAMLVLVMILGLAAGYCWRHDVVPHIPWNQSGTVKALEDAGVKPELRQDSRQNFTVNQDMLRLPIDNWEDR